MRFRSTCVVGLAALGLMLGGCKSDKGATNEPVISSMKNVRASMEACKVAVDKTQAVLSELPSTTDIKASYEKLNAAVANLNSQAVELREQAGKMRAQGDLYVEQWKKEMDQVQDADIKASAAKRREAVAASFAGIRDTAVGARQSYTSYSASLTAIQTTLKNDMTAGGLAMLGDKIKKTQGEGAVLKTELEKLIGDLDNIKAGMATTRPTAPAK